MDFNVMHPAAVATTAAAAAVATTAASEPTTRFATTAIATSSSTAIGTVYLAGCGPLWASHAGRVLRRRMC